MTATSKELPKRQELSGVIIEHTSKRMKHAFAKILADNFESKITVDQWVVLYELYKHGPLNQYEIASHAYKDAPTVTRIIDLLLSKEYILKSLDDSDRRRFSIALSEIGKNLVCDIIPFLQEFRKTCYQDISEAELQSLEKILNKINSNLQ